MSFTTNITILNLERGSLLLMILETGKDPGGSYVQRLKPCMLKNAVLLSPFGVDTNHFNRTGMKRNKVVQLELIFMMFVSLMRQYSKKNKEEVWVKINRVI